MKIVVTENARFHKTLSLFDYIDPSIFGNWFTVVFLLLVLLYFLLVLWLVPKGGCLIFRVLNNGEDVIMTCFLFLILLAVLAGEFLGINLVVGAFLAGLGLSRIMQDPEYRTTYDVFHKFEGIGYGFLIPFLFISIGMKTDLHALFESASNVGIIVLTIAGLVVSKVFSGCCGWSTVCPPQSICQTAKRCLCGTPIW